MTFNIYDMLVFEDQAGSIYQDCVCKIERQPIEVDYTDAGNDCYFTNIICNNVVITLDDCGSLISINPSTDLWYDHSLNLKEIWTKTSDNTYEKVWWK